jgi:hypothetical protein
MPTTVREIPVTIYLDNEYIGYGSIVYEDESAIQLVDTIKYKCINQELCINSECYSDAVEFCYEDKVSSFLGGLEVKTLKVNVYDYEGNVIGDAVLNLYDSYNPSIFWVMLNIALLWALTIALLAVLHYMKRRVGEKV